MLCGVSWGRRWWWELGGCNEGGGPHPGAPPTAVGTRRGTPLPEWERGRDGTNLVADVEVSAASNEE
jgi:hypothetical protein